ncbi:MAG: DUF6384 family protein [Devosia sp.]|jgi:hypothetical protein|uniref:DUF6384 family protein n=1 Tax=Devosia sp. TaxID=1871048 RepID=UPI0037C18D27
MSTAEADTAPLDDVMLAMDVVDTLRHNQDLVTRELSEGNREQQLIDKLREIYRQQGIDVPDHILKEGVTALSQSRFVYTPPKPGLGTTLARLYVARRRWLPALTTAVVLLAVAFGGYFLAYKPFEQSQIEAARNELQVVLPAQMDAVYQTIFEETKVQQAATSADELRSRGKAYAAEGDKADAERVLAEMTAIRDTLRQVYTLKIVNRTGVKSGFWTFPEINTDATNYYVVVEALDETGKPLSLPVLNEENGVTETVPLWGLRVPESVYRTVEADKRDDGIIQGNTVGLKQYGFLDIDYTVPVLGGAVTRW